MPHWTLDGNPANGVGDLVAGQWMELVVDLDGLGLTQFQKLEFVGNGDGGDVYYMDDVTLGPS